MVEPQRGWILDFDGTLAPGLTEAALTHLEADLARLGPVPPGLVRAWAPLGLALEPQEALECLYRGLGHPGAWQGLARAWAEEALAPDQIDPAWPDLKAWAQARDRSLVVFSAGGAGSRRFEALGRGGWRACLPAGPKSAPATWRQLARDLGGASGWLVVEDTPLALWAAAQAGFAGCWCPGDPARGRPERPAWLDPQVPVLDSLAELLPRGSP